MKHLYLFLFCTIFLLISCGEDDIVDDTGVQDCLLERKISVSSNFCEEPLTNCTYTYLGYQGISETAKVKFPDFCKPLFSTIDFKDVNGQTLEGQIIDKKFENGNYKITSFAPGSFDDCERFCLDNEQALFVLETLNFKLEMILYTGIELNIDSDNVPVRVPEVAISVFAYEGNSKQHVFKLPLEDQLGQPIIPDTFNIRFHPTISLNGKEFNNIYSNENNEHHSLKRKEKVYYHPENGLIAVKDSLDIVWLIEN